VPAGAERIAMRTPPFWHVLARSQAAELTRAGVLLHSSAMLVAILGYGRFGRALGQLLADAQIPYRALDPAGNVPADVCADSMRTLTAGANVVFVAVPVSRIRAALTDLRPHVGPGQIIVDVGSVKVRPVEALAEAMGDAVPWVGTHPLFGPLSLALAERPLRVVVCPTPAHPEATSRVRALYEKIGCEVIEQTPEAHDRVMAHTHALTFFVAKGMMDAGAGVDVPFAPPSFQAIARAIETVRSDAGHLFAAIQRENPFSREARAHLVDALASVHRMLEREEPAEDAAPDSTRFAIPDLGSRSPELKETREHIDALDREIVELLSRRTQLARRAARAKATLGAPVLDPTREAQILEKRRAWAGEVGLEPDGLDDIFRAIIRVSRSAQR
jgi:prephenate dehydrogenase